MKKSSLILGSVLGLALTVTGVLAATTGPFKDTTSTHWAYPAVEWARTTALIEGYTDGTFGGDKNLSRYEMVQILSKYDKAWVVKMDAMKKEAMDKMAVMQKEIDALKVGHTDDEDDEDDKDDEEDKPVAGKEMYYAGMSGKQEVPSVNTTAKGMADFWVEGGKLYYDITVTGLKADEITGAHIHKAEAGK